MEEEKKNVLCALLLTDGVCCVEEKGGEEEGKKKKSSHKSLAWQPIAERELSSLADSSRCNIVAALFFSYIFWCVYIRDCCTPYTLPLGLLAILLTTP